MKACTIALVVLVLEAAGLTHERHGVRIAHTGCSNAVAFDAWSVLEPRGD